MKAINKFFAIAAIAATSMFSVQTASAAVVSTYDATTSEYTGYTFVALLGDDWSKFDELLVGNANREEIVLTGAELYCRYTAGAITMNDCTPYWTKLNSLGCPQVLTMALLLKMKGYDPSTPCLR